MITPEDFPENLHIPHEERKLKITGSAATRLKEALAHPEKDLIIDALEKHNWNRNETAGALGINRTTLYKKMRKFGLLKKGNR